MNILCFGAHPDDLEIGMGGTIARYVKAGHRVHMVVVCAPYAREVRIEEAQASAEILGAELIFLDYPTEQLAFNRNLVRTFDGIVSRTNPDELYTHWTHDSHQDHTIVARACFAAARNGDISVCTFEQIIPGGVAPYGFRASRYSDISDVIDKKINCLKEHKSQVEKYGKRWLEAIKGRAAWRGYQIHVDYAEAFDVAKELLKI